MFNNSENTNRRPPADEIDRTPKRDGRLAVETAFHRQVRKLYKDTTANVLRQHKIQSDSQRRAVADMTRALQMLVTQTTEMVGFMIGTLLAGADVSGKNMFANFLDMLGQFAVMLGSVAIAASKVLSALFTGNPVALLASGIALVAIGGVVKAFAAQLKSQGAGLGSGSSMPGSIPLGDGSATGSASLTPLDRSRKTGEGEQNVYYYHFEGGMYDERGLARIAAKAINDHAGRTAPLIAARAIGER